MLHLHRTELHNCPTERTYSGRKNKTNGSDSKAHREKAPPYRGIFQETNVGGLITGWARGGNNYVLSSV